MTVLGAVAELGYTIGHVLIFTGYLVAVVVVGPAFNRVLRVRPLTIIAAGGFFWCCGVTHLGLALELERPGQLLFQINDIAQTLSIWTFLICLYIDMQDAVDRLAIAFIQIRGELGVRADWIEQIIIDAFRGTDSRTPGADDDHAP